MQATIDAIYLSDSAKESICCLLNFVNSATAKSSPLATILLKFFTQGKIHATGRRLVMPARTEPTTCSFTAWHWAQLPLNRALPAAISSA